MLGYSYYNIGLRFFFKWVGRSENNNKYNADMDKHDKKDIHSKIHHYFDDYIVQNVLPDCQKLLT